MQIMHYLWSRGYDADGYRQLTRKFSFEEQQKVIGIFDDLDAVRGTSTIGYDD